ncbi:hypothetical protein CPB86DRAFT_182390 [Serendipita vermifera]|nr:hypothetical protein CPB86DRAFT_182390 [Serendipita vermifera]
MFKKDFKVVKTSAPLRSSDQKKLRKAVTAQFKLYHTDAELLVPDMVLAAKFTNHLDVQGIVYFDKDGIPIWFQEGTKPVQEADLVPTVYSLWKRTFLPIVTTPQLVIDKLRNGADLMAPGVAGIRASHANPLPLSANQLVCVIAYSREIDCPPMAVGRMAMSSSEIAAADKGKAVYTLHTYGDVLWEKGGKGEPPKELVIVHPQQGGTEVPSTQINPEEGTQDTLRGVEIAISGEENPPQAQEKQESIPQATGATETSQDIHLEASEVDQVLRSAMLLCFQSEGPSLSFPYSASAFYTDGILPFRPSGTDASSFVIKNSSFKKLKPFMKSAEKEGILKLKELSGELSIVAVDFSHDKIIGQARYRTLGDDQKKISQAKAAEEAANAAPRTMTITEFYKPHGSSLSLFNAVRASTSSYYTVGQLRDDVLWKYVAENSLVHPTERAYIVLDDSLKNVLLTKKESDEFLRRDDALQRFIRACQAWHEVTQEGRTSEKRKGKLVPISITIKMRQGKKAVTLVTNYEPFFLDAETMSEDFRKICAAQTSVSPIPGKANQLEVLVQGKQSKAVSEYLMDKGVPKRWIEIEDTTEKKKGK